jgi:hypothetical protein
VVENYEVDLCPLDISLGTDLLSLTQIYVSDLLLELRKFKGKVQLRTQRIYSQHAELVCPQPMHERHPVTAA